MNIRIQLIVNVFSKQIRKQSFINSLAFLMFIFLISFQLPAQKINKYSFVHLTTTNGLAANLVNNMKQDSRGYMWFATINGLQRYDGKRFITFQSSLSNKKSIPSDNITVIFFDKRNRLWITGVNNKIGTFDTDNFQFREAAVYYKTPPKEHRYKHFIDMEDGSLLMYEVRGEIYLYDEKSHSFKPNNKQIPLPPGWKPVLINKDSIQKKLWITTDSGLMVFNTTTRALSYKGHNVENDPVIQRYENEKNLLGIRADLYNNILFIQWFPDKSLPLLHRFDRNTNAVTTFNLSNELGIGYHELYGFLQQQNKRMWIYGMPVFAEWSTDRTRFFPITNNVDYKGESGIHFQRVSAGFEDKDGNLWLATDNGIYLFNPNAQFFDTYYVVEAQKRETTDASISCVWQMPNGNIFVSTYLTGLHYYDQQLNKIALPPALQIAQRDVTVWDIQQHSRTGKLWFSLQRGEKALMIYDTAKKNITWIKDSIFKKSTVRQLTEDNEGNLWFGLYGGNLIKWDYDQSGGNIEKGYSIALRIGEHINKLLVDNEGYLWIATSGAGILRINPKNNKIVARFSTKAPTGHQLLRDVVTDMIQYDNNTIAATGGNVYLIHTKTNKVTQLTSADGLPSSTAVSIQKDVNGILWLGLANGICRLNLIKKTYTLYDRKDGITYDNFEQPGAFQISGNRLLFSTPKNFITFKPSALRIDTPQPPIITSFRLANQMLLLDSILNEKRAVLQYDNSSIAIEFSNLNYLSGSKLRYYYMLEGLDKDWIRADESKQALYNYIPHGNYTFKVKSENEDGISSAHYTSLSIKVIPPFWKTWLFYGMMALLLLIIIFTIDQERMKRIRTVHQMRSQIGNDLHSDIHSTLNDINVLSSMAKMKADKDIIRSKQYIEQISDKSSTMMESMDDILWSIDPQNDSMKKMLLRIQEHNDAIKNTYSTDIVLTADEGMNKMLLNMRDRHEFLLFYKQAIQFCLQQGQQLPIHVVLTNKKGNFQLQVQAKCDNIEHDQNTLKDIKNDMQLRADALSATLEIFYTKKNITIVLQKNYRS